MNAYFYKKIQMSRRFWFHLVLLSASVIIGALSLLEISKEVFFEFQALHLTLLGMILLVISIVGQGLQEFMKIRKSKQTQEN
ncbi:hypothetical protein BC751_1967 [Cecembia calidifontis]|uniref:Uncharacterized protein n=1 Tax=Cecembia calidifontis TaxID=1187080 RepID=A0A4Q7P8A0_9BACT|nr:hypothetical protein BC751_1967 [Cecembia calidifontis]